MSDNKCDPILNIQIPDLTLNQIQNLANLGINRPLTLQDIIQISQQPDVQDSQQAPSRSAASSPSSSQPSQQNNSRPSSSQGGSGGSPPIPRECEPVKEERGGWDMPFSSYGNVQGIEIEPRELNCDCIGN